MQSSSGLYEDSDDDESLTNELSPTDGYFNRRPVHPQDILVPDPSQDTTESDKAREVQQEASQASATPRSPSRHTTPSTSSRPRLSPDFEDDTSTERSGLISSAPPAYSPYPANGIHQQPTIQNPTRSEHVSRGYNTMGRQDIFLPAGEPEDLGGQSSGGYSDLNQGDWRKRAQRFFKIKYFIVFLALLTTIWFLVSTIKMLNNKMSTKPIGDTPDSDWVPGAVPRQCPSGVHAQRTSLSFPDPSEFAFLEVRRDFVLGKSQSYDRVRSSGEIHIRSATEHAEDGIQVDIEWYSSDPRVTKATLYSQESDSVKVYTPTRIPANLAAPQPCLHVNATIWINPGQVLSELRIDTESFTVNVHEDLSFEAHTLTIGAVSGAVNVPRSKAIKSSYSYRKVVVESVSGSIRGDFALYDLLQVTTVSGTIDVTIDPKEVSEKDPAPAQLKLKTTSGSIYAKTPIINRAIQALPASSIPARDYITTIESTSGTLQVTLIHGRETKLHTSSASIYATLLPVGPLSDKSSIDSATLSGTTQVTILESITHPSQPMRNLYGSHTSQSGSMYLKYPGQWQGDVGGSTVSGSIYVKWPALEIFRLGREPGSNLLQGKVGPEGGGDLRFKGTSSTVTLESKSKNSFYDGGKSDRDRWRGDRGDIHRGPVEHPVGESPPNDEPGMGIVPPRWPGYRDEWELRE